jgi:HPt (histidine-containing phosphotransfer) domain-containing protein
VLQRYLKTAQDSHEASALEEEIIPLDDELQELLNQRVKEMSEELGEARKVNDLDRVKAVVHMIKGSIGSFGYLGISALAADIEEQLRQEDVTEYNRGLDLLNQRLLAILSE